MEWKGGRGRFVVPPQNKWKKYKIQFNFRTKDFVLQKYKQYRFNVSEGLVSSIYRIPVDALLHFGLEGVKIHKIKKNIF